MMNTNRTYSKLITMDSFMDRYEYLKLGGSVGHSTFGFDRYLNQQFYASREWKDVREAILLRDNGCDLGVKGREIYARPVVHHVNPVEPHHIIHSASDILDPEFLITTSHNTHLAIHYGDKGMLPREFVERKAGDTRLW